MKISVIVAAYNIEKYIKRCLKSIVNQTLNDIEIIVVNDGSTDNTLEIINDINKNYKNIKVINKKNAGLIEARKSGFNISIGEYVLFVDGDDWLELNALEKLYNKAISSNADVVMYHAFTAYEEKKEKRLTFNKFREYGEDCLEDLFIGNIAPLIWAKLIKRSFIIENNIEFPSNINYGEDLGAVSSIFMKRPKVESLNEYLYNYYQRKDSIANIKNDNVLEIFKVIEFIEQQLKANNLYEEYIKQFECLIFEHSFFGRLNNIENFKNDYKYIHKEIYDRFKIKKIECNKNKYILERINRHSLKYKIMVYLYKYNYYLGMYSTSIVIKIRDYLRGHKKQKISNMIYESKKALKYTLSFHKYNEIKEYKNVKKIVYLLTPVHGNIGDQAIAFATNKFLKEKFKDYKVLEFTRDDIYRYGKSIKKILNKDDIIILHGGGNMGNLYIKEEVARRLIISKFKYNKIISMPQTMSFTNDEEGKRELQKTKKIYNKHKDLTLIAREKYSYDMMKREIENAKVINNPDIVTYLHDMFEFDKENRVRIMTCLRNDKEGILGQDKDIFINELNKAYKDVFHYDTVINKVVTKETRESELNAMFDEFRKSKVVITDRLHGMIFCVITKTPCIVTKSLDHKVTGTYEWFKDLNYIRFVDKLDFNNVKPIIDELSNLEDLNEINFKEIYFDKLREKLAL